MKQDCYAIANVPGLFT